MQNRRKTLGHREQSQTLAAKIRRIETSQTVRPTHGRILIPMKTRCLPLWLLRDVPALLGVMISFWPLMILVIRNGLAAMRGKPVPRSAFEKLPHLLAHAESWLDFAILREAHRRLGWNHRSIPFALHASPETWPDTEMRFHRYQRIRRDPEASARACVEDLRAQYGISKRALAAHGSTDAALHAAAHHELVGAAPPQALILSSAHRARPSKDERGPAHARGPPLHLNFSKPNPQYLAGSSCEAAPVCAKEKPRKARGSPGLIIQSLTAIS